MMLAGLAVEYPGNGVICRKTFYTFKLSYRVPRDNFTEDLEKADLLWLDKSTTTTVMSNSKRPK
jgi:hypothetical protein